MNWKKLIRNLGLGVLCFAVGYMIAQPALLSSPVMVVLVPVAIFALIFFLRRR